MRIGKSFSIAFSFVGALFGAGLASGKEIAVFLGDSSIIGVLACSITIGLFATLFMVGASCTKGTLIDFIFGRFAPFGKLLVRVINLVFLSAMFGGAESLFLETINFKGGSIIIAVMTLGLFYFGKNSIKGLNNIVVPLTILVFTLLFVPCHNTICGNHNVLRPILYASMNTTCAGLFLGENAKSLSKKDITIIGLIIATIISLLFLMIRSIIIGAEMYNFPIVSVAQDTYLHYFCVFIVACAILTSSLCNLKLSSEYKGELSPFIMVSYAMLIAGVGFNKLVTWLYPIIGAISGIILVTLFVRVISLKLNVKKQSVYL